MKILEAANEIFKRLQQKKPLVHHITNYVTVNDCANITLAVGALPIMADDLEEVEEITALASALVLNIGTLNTRTIESMICAGRKANAMGIPIVFDPVGAGASAFRSKTTEKILAELKIDILRGNMSEMRSIAGLASSTNGVDASQKDRINNHEQGIEFVSSLAKQCHCIVAATGATDYIACDKKAVAIENGHPQLSAITGTGCMTTSLVGSFAGAVDNLFEATVYGVLTMGIAGEIAYETSGDKKNGSFHMAVLDAVSNMNGDVLKKRAEIYETAC